ncbi:MAG TPA: hypothetical protein VEC14_01545 [Reyranellaceae bacterium]|nr:hypothetical protein [Reyranellaceae bacterium]
MSAERRSWVIVAVLVSAGLAPPLIDLTAPRLGAQLWRGLDNMLLAIFATVCGPGLLALCIYCIATMPRPDKIKPGAAASYRQNLYTFIFGGCFAAFISYISFFK